MPITNDDIEPKPLPQCYDWQDVSEFGLPDGYRELVRGTHDPDRCRGECKSDRFSQKERVIVREK